jgi:hypothetical protein
VYSPRAWRSAAWRSWSACHFAPISVSTHPLYGSLVNFP